MGVYKRGGSWWYDLTIDGVRERKRIFGAETKIQAKEAFAARKADILRGEYKLGEKEKKMRFDELADEVYKYAKGNLTDSARYKQAFAHQKKYFRGKFISAITAKDVEDFKLERIKNVKPGTVNRELSILKRTFSLAVEWKYMTENPVKKVRLFKTEDYDWRILTKEEAYDLVNAPTGYIKDLITAALNTGMRQGELLGLRWSDVDFLNQFIFIKNSKSGKQRKVPMNYLVVQTLEGIDQISEYVFANPETGRKRSRAVWKRFRTACRHAGIDSLRFHDLRHTAATFMVQEGIDLVTVKEILGHADISMTVKYCHPTPENKRRAADTLAKVFGMPQNCHKIEGHQGKMTAYARRGP